ncbi:potassium-transporting ATPase subunit A [Bacillus methanolicus MGA3]|uniref:Putative membrane protein n=1 Tax=Bacillus methanolicus (strain MGA3 / ATCC 53907) TaxID=796606 RepID=I3E3C5_BACMM|nr:putative membrane protein [Bacillus methanolicus MGA3]EIJ80996.1 potassium-transporting ATPase subunit A [Bacillus methanolicus MGA3]
MTCASTGLAVAIAIIHALFRREKVIGNFYQDFVKANVRVLFPFAVVVTLLLVALGVPQTLASSTTVTTLEVKLRQ